MRLIYLALISLSLLSACSSRYMPSTPWQKISTPAAVEKHLETGLIEFQGKFYAVGGRGKAGISIYDPATNNWSEGAKPPYSLHHFQPVIYQNAIIVAGAMTGNFPNDIPATNLYYYYPLEDRWETKEAIPSDRVRGSCGAVIHEDKLYLISGITQGHQRGHVPWLDEFDLLTRQWKRLSNAPRARDHFQAAMIEDKIYAIAGRNSSQATGQPYSLTISEIDVYDIESGNWMTLPREQNIPTPRAGASTLVIDDEIWLIGGESQHQNAAHDEIEAYYPNEGVWFKHQNLNTGRHGTGAIYYNGKLWTGFGSSVRGEEKGSVDMVNLTIDN